MPAENPQPLARQDGAEPWRERLPLPADDAMTPDQRAGQTD